MDPIRAIAAVALIAVAAGCNGGTSTDEIERAAVERTREQFGLPVGAQLDTTVWVGEPQNGEITVCGTISGSGIPPQRFAARTSPIRWLVFENAHQAMIASQPDKFIEWSTACAGEN